MITPCHAWAEKLALRREDLSAADQAALDVHLTTCPACRKVLDDYTFLDTALKALSSPAVKPLPRLILEMDDLGGGEVAASFAEDAEPEQWQRVARHSRSRPVRRRMLRMMPMVAVASILLCIVLVSSLYYTSTTTGHAAGATLVTFQKHSDFVSAVAWSPDGHFVASGSWDHSVKVWNALTGALVTTYAPAEGRSDGGGHTELVDALAWSPDGHFIASGSWDHTVQVWNAITGQLITIYRGHNEEVSSLAWSPDGHFIASGSWDHTVQTWEVFTGVHLRTFMDDNNIYGLVNAVSWSPDGRYIASGGGNNRVQIWDTQSRSNVALFTYVYSYSDPVNTLAWSPDGHYIAAGGRDNQVQIWDVRMGQPVMTYKGHHGEVNSLVWSPNGTMIASGSDDHTVQIWNVKDGVTLLTYKGHSDNVDALAWSPDGTRIASGSWDDTVKIWEALPGK
ncbi:MAG TPA: hypothetical protein VKR06_07015 [Ktedonosporobacter sp.]|nr:hypothetical protein [Ktedonosporobacter sp.]